MFSTAGNSSCGKVMFLQVSANEGWLGISGTRSLQEVGISGTRYLLWGRYPGGRYVEVGIPGG